MKFNRKAFIDETTGNLGIALDMIDELIGILNGYIADDEAAEGYGAGCYGKSAEERVFNWLRNKNIDEYIIR